MALPSTLVAERKHYTGLLAYPCDHPAFIHSIGDRLLEKDVLAGFCRHARGFQVSVIRCGVDYCLNARLFQDRLVARCRRAIVLCREGPALIVGTRKARYDLELVGTLHRISEHVRPPTYSNYG